MGAGQGFERGVQQLSQNVMQLLRLNMQQKRYDQLNERFDKAIDYGAEFKRGRQGLPPSYTEEEEAAQAAATRPEVPSSTPTVTPGQLGVPQSSFPVGPPVQPMLAQPSKPAGAMALIPPAMRPPSMGIPRMRRGY